MGNYPDGTWEGDPRAPWNRCYEFGWPGSLEECARCGVREECELEAEAGRDEEV